MVEKIRLGISSCLLGEKVRYDGGHKLDPFFTETLGKYVELVPVCPEVECGLPVPREAMHLAGDPESPRLVTVGTGIDHTEKMLKWAEGKLGALDKAGLCGFVFKSRSPSSGMRGIKVYSRAGVARRRGVGIFAKAYMKRFPLMPVEDDERLHDPALRENFIGRVFVFRRWKEFLRREGTAKGLVAFHRDHELIILAHSPKHSSSLGRLITEVGKYRFEDLSSAYGAILMEGLRLVTTVRKNTDVLHRVAGYLKKRLSSDEREELLAMIEDYHEERAPLIVPVTLLNHYAREYDEPHLKRQHYLNPHPTELMLRNHV